MIGSLKYLCFTQLIVLALAIMIQLMENLIVQFRGMWQSIYTNDNLFDSFKFYDWVCPDLVSWVYIIRVPL